MVPWCCNQMVIDSSPHSRVPVDSWCVERTGPGVEINIPMPSHLPKRKRKKATRRGAAGNSSEIYSCGLDLDLARGYLTE